MHATTDEPARPEWAYDLDMETLLTLMWAIGLLAESSHCTEPGRVCFLSRDRATAALRTFWLIPRRRRLTLEQAREWLVDAHHTQAPIMDVVFRYETSQNVLDPRGSTWPLTALVESAEFARTMRSNKYTRHFVSARLEHVHALLLGVHALSRGEMARTSEPYVDHVVLADLVRVAKHYVDGI